MASAPKKHQNTTGHTQAMKNSALNRTTASLFTLVLSSASGCATTPLEDDFGNSVRQMIAAQQAHPEVSANPDPNPVDSTDAVRVERALETYRQDPTLPDSDSQEPVIEIGAGQGLGISQGQGQ